MPTETTITRRCEFGDCNYQVRYNGKVVIDTSDFSCPNRVWNPQYPVYVVCRKKIDAIDEACLCQPFREARRKIAAEKHIHMDRYIKILKIKSLEAPLK